MLSIFFFQAEDGIRDGHVTGVQTCALPISMDKQPQDVASMFDHVAPRYDLTNDVLSFGQDRLWRRATVDAIAARRGERILDVAAGTGTSSEPFRDAGGRVVACDFSRGMVEVGKARRPELLVVVADATALPFYHALFGV